ncbi:hypothetical protein IBX73_05080 [candidate division WOR-3 bacterium]|nr:hypothetical protein [candidate division WOR-3 bacterium]
MELNVKILAAALAATINLILVVLVSLRNRRHIVFRSFILVSFCLLFWNLRVIISGLSEPAGMDSIYAIVITQIFYPMVTACLYILPVATLQFTVSIVALDSRLMSSIVKTAYVAALVMSLIFASGVFSSWLYDRLLWLFILPLFTLSLFLLGRAFVRSRRPLEKTRFGLLFVGGTVGVTGAITEDILIATGVNIGGLGNIANAVYSIIVATCLLRHRLFDVMVTTRRAAGIVISASLLIFVSYLIAQIFNFTDMMPYGHILVTVLLLVMLGHKIIPHTERILFRGTGSLYQTIDGIRRSLDRTSNAHDLLKITAEMAMDMIGTAACLCAARDEISRQFTRHYSSDARGEDAIQSKAFDDLIQWMDRHRSDEPLVYDELCHRLRFDYPTSARREITARIISDIQVIGYEVYAPLSIDNELHGIMCLANKTNGYAFTERDIRVLKIIAYNCALQLQHLNLSERIRQLETLAALGEMAACIAHEVRNPLAVIRSSAQLAQSRHRDRSALSMIIDECDRLNRVVTKMLDFTKTPRPDPRRIDIQSEIRTLAGDIVNSCAQQQIQLRVECPADLPAVVFDPDHLKQIITNLLLNAIEATDGPGMIEISLSRSDRMIRLVIHDSGSGVRRKDLGNIFKPFHTTKLGGSGLGLPITRRLLELNNGTIEIRPRHGKGCSVILRLPAWSDEHE